MSKGIVYAFEETHTFYRINGKAGYNLLQVQKAEFHALPQTLVGAVWDNYKSLPAEQIKIEGVLWQE